MPVAFSDEERLKISKKLLEGARYFVGKQCVRKITVEQLTEYAGISKGAFYLFYPAKEYLFYELLRQMHEELYAPAMRLLSQTDAAPAKLLTKAILEGCRALDESGLVRFWEQDAPEILRVIPEIERAEQTAKEQAVFHEFLIGRQPLLVSESQAMKAVSGLIMTVPMRKQLGDDYPEILLWMAQGICANLFGE